MLRPELQKSLSMGLNDHGDVVIQVGSRSFVPDLAFMKRFAVCGCGILHQWEYFYSK
jgi:hypothetical protein